MKISYVNVIADLCEKLGGDVEEVTRAMGLDPRIGPQFLRAGLGFGGFCLPKDVQAFVYLAETVGINFELLKAAEGVNRQHIESFLEKVRKALWVVKGKRVAVLGLAFKAFTDDIRFSPAVEVVRRLLEEGAEVRAFDPEASVRAEKALPKAAYFRDPFQAAQDAEALLICTEWPEFRELDWTHMGAILARRLVIDGRNLLDPARMRALGFEYHSFGRPE